MILDWTQRDCYQGSLQRLGLWSEAQSALQMKLALHAIGDDAVRTLPSRTESGLAPELESANCDSEHKYDLEIETVCRKIFQNRDIEYS